MKDEYVSIEHVLLASAAENGAVVRKLGLTREKLMEALAAVRGQPARHAPDPEATYEALEKYGRDLTGAGARRASSIRSSAATTRSAASSRCSRGAPRTTRC